MIDATGQHCPDHCTGDVLEYVTELYATAGEDAPAAVPSLQAEFGFSKLQAEQCLTYWLKQQRPQHKEV